MIVRRRVERVSGQGRPSAGHALVSWSGAAANRMPREGAPRAPPLVPVVLRTSTAAVLCPTAEGAGAVSVSASREGAARTL